MSVWAPRHHRQGLGGSLLPFQQAGVEYILTRRRCFRADEMGLGKTVQALVAVHSADYYPALVIRPKSLQLIWKREVERWLPGVVVAMPEKGNQAPIRSDVMMATYEQPTRHDVLLRSSYYRALIVDEAHSIKNARAERSQRVHRLARDGMPLGLVLLLSGTPVLNRPSELVHPLDVLGYLPSFGGREAFLQRYCDPSHTGYGWDYSGASHLDELNDRLWATCYLRRTKAEVLPQLPPKRRTVVPLSLVTMREYRAAATASYGGGRDAAELVRINTLRSAAAWGKLEAVKAWVDDFLQSGEKLVLFGWHRDIVKELAATFDAPAVIGEMSAWERRMAVDEFQGNPACRLIVLTLGAGGLGLTLTAASNVAFVELPWTPAALDQAEDRLHRVGQRASSVYVWYLIGDGTIDEDILTLIDEKRTVVRAATEAARNDPATTYLAVAARIARRFGTVRLK